MKIATGKDDPEIHLLQKIRSLELTAPQIAAQINASYSSSNRHISTSTVQRLVELLHAKTLFTKSLLLKNKKAYTLFIKNVIFFQKQ